MICSMPPFHYPKKQLSIDVTSPDTFVSLRRKLADFIKFNSFRIPRNSMKCSALLTRHCHIIANKSVVHIVVKRIVKWWTVNRTLIRNYSMAETLHGQHVIRKARRIHVMSTESLTTVEMNTSPSSTQVQDSFLLLLLKHIVANIVRVPLFYAVHRRRRLSRLTEYQMDFSIYTFRFSSFFAAPLHTCGMWLCVCVRELALMPVLSCLHNRAIIFRVKVWFLLSAQPPAMSTHFLHSNWCYIISSI